MDYLPHMQVIQSDILAKVMKEVENYDEARYQASDVLEALNSHHLNIEHLKALLSSAAEDFIEDLALKASKLKLKYFGNNIALFTPLYLSNFCNSKCVYCGFQKGNKITRAKLDEQEIHAEMAAIAQSGLQEILMLTGEGREFASVAYIARACEIAREYFKVVGVEIYPMNVDEYALLHKSGCDYVTIFQETYNELKYSKIHLAGEKSVFKYRFFGQERALMAGMRGVAFGALLGIDNFRKDALACVLHAYFLQQKYPHAEFSLSIPRLRPIINNTKISPKDVSEKRLLQVLCAYRLFLPFAHISLSSRERIGFRDEAIKLGVSKMSAGVSVGIGEHSGAKKGDEQFEICDDRSVGEIITKLRNLKLQPVMSDSVYVG
ncbi:2-iminoacetate synthase ThiH [Campylobacter vulpis]|uniref:2-iminoacetate synthase ThiH n=1 Tax=Campylobacter vulpis TaxID=1655500 RepID=A0A2G4QZE5_9BACT|nr:2-iminoacetate synthase ThiH [Campylobacter vulpis]MBS4240536.1 2-iminoacetate synthase ThiH [Campylobacter vulpis]MBS4251951.1 2-iminoacetate synthase ThiH [Campylobacter vulpis]MBS4281126.1 2-iminoacetate synthase ThiH [Campylobacter vulpis]MBS4313070.1 2-iminoacetate synthase ThiH [Campylobacter vulpis]MBS4329377.1 2-iminoacetate synthase ThiH [Campylobacter vulpis]